MIPPVYLGVVLAQVCACRRIVTFMLVDDTYVCPRCEHVWFKHDIVAAVEQTALRCWSPPLDTLGLQHEG